ncbi:MAG: DUF5706 domain-containing protein [Chitinophagaceae bacterium]
MNYQLLVKQVQEYVLPIFNTVNGEKLFYHNREHTEQVVKAATTIANHYQLNDHDFFIVITAAWFHDIGYYTTPARHEEVGAEQAAAFLQAKGVDEATINAIKGCIMATRLPQHPVNLLEQIVCDADLFHLGGDNFMERNKLMRKEASARFDKKIDKDEWRNATIRLMEMHHYHTDYARVLLNDQKQANLEQLKRKAEEKEKHAHNAAPTVAKQPVTHTAVVTNAATPANKAEAKEEKKKKEDRPNRGIETMFRISSNNHQRLSDMADSKAHIMISTNSIIISVLLSVLLRKLEEYPNYTIPAILLLTVCVVAMVFSILATRPNIPEGTFTQDDIDQKKVNLLFFGNFYKMSLEDYTGGMLRMMNERDFLYGSLIRDLYSQGVVLGRKYRLLRVGYNVFMFGIVASVVAFIIAALIKR